MILVIPPNHTERFAFPQIGVFYLATSLREKGHRATIVDCQFCRDYMSEIVRKLDSDMAVGFYLTTYSYNFVRNMARLLKDRFGDEIRIILGGPHASHKPEELVRDFADIVVSGEGESILPQILEGVDSADIPSLTYRGEQGETVTNRRGELASDLDSLPFPDWGLVDYRKYSFTHYRRRPLVSIMTSRGCRYKCIYCSSRIVHKMQTRMRSPGNVADEMERDIRDYGIRELHVVDDDFTYDVDRVKDICEEIIRRGLERKILLAKPNGIRPDRGDQEMFDLMKRAGFYFTAIAVEAVNPEVSRKLGRGADVERHYETIAMARKSGLFINTFFLMGSPYDTPETMRENIDFACSCPTDIVSFFIIRPFPGTPLFNNLVKTGAIEDMDHCNIPSCNETTYLFSGENWDVRTLNQMVRTAYRKFYLSPARMFKLMFRLPLFISNPAVLLRLLLNLLKGGTPAADSGAAREAINGRVSGAAH